MSVLEILGSVLTELEKVQEKLDRLLASGPYKGMITGEQQIAKEIYEGEKPTVIEKTIIKGGRTIPVKGSGKYEWFPVKGMQGVKVRACSNEGCPYYLKYNEDKGKYEHWKYDPNTQEGGFVQDNCDHYFPEGI